MSKIEKTCELWYPSIANTIQKEKHTVVKWEAIRFRSIIDTAAICRDNKGEMLDY